jgi:CheY-like chemotaxis protein
MYAVGRVGLDCQFDLDDLPEDVSLGRLAVGEMQYLDMLRLSAEESSYLIDKLDADDMSREGGGSQGANIVRVRWSVPLRVEFADGNEQGFRVLTRAIRSDSIDVLHGGYLHTGLPCILTLMTQEGEGLVLHCTVGSCEHLSGRVHKMRLALSSHLDSTLLQSIGNRENKPGGSELSQLGGKLLHVEDSDLDTTLLHQTLKDTSVRIVDSEHGFGAIAAIERESFDAVLCDLTLPDMSGESLILALREHNFTGPIAIVTGIREKVRLQGALAAGACDILLKPYLKERMHKTLSRVLPKIGSGQMASENQASSMSSSIANTLQVLARDMASLPAAVASREFDVVRFRLARVHGSARNAKTRSLEIAADRAVRALDRGGAIKYAAREITAVIQEWEALSVPKAA